MIVGRFLGYLFGFRPRFDYGSLQVGVMGELTTGIIGGLGRDHEGPIGQKFKIKETSCQL
jgi:hypothetical protein